MLPRLFHRRAQRGQSLAHALRQRLIAATKPAFLRHQLGILRRSVKRPRCTLADRTLLVLLASRFRAWRQALLNV